VYWGISDFSNIAIGSTSDQLSHSVYLYGLTQNLTYQYKIEASPLDTSSYDITTTPIIQFTTSTAPPVSLTGVIVNTTWNGMSFQYRTNVICTTEFYYGNPPTTPLPVTTSNGLLHYGQETGLSKYTLYQYYIVATPLVNTYSPYTKPISNFRTQHGTPVPLNNITKVSTNTTCTVSLDTGCTALVYINYGIGNYDTKVFAASSDYLHHVVTLIGLLPGTLYNCNISAEPPYYSYNPDIYPNEPVSWNTTFITTGP